MYIAMGDPSPTPTLAFNGPRTLRAYNAGTQNADFTISITAPTDIPRTASITNRENPAVEGASTASFIGTTFRAVVPTLDPTQLDISATVDATVTTRGVTESFMDLPVSRANAISVTDQRREPRINGTTTNPLVITKTILDGSNTDFTVDFTGGGSIALGTAFDAVRFVVENGPGQINAVNVLRFPPSIANASSTISFPNPGARSNGQDGNPNQRTCRVDRTTPWFVGTHTSAPASEADIIAAGRNIQQVTTNLVPGTNSRTNFMITGVVGDPVYIIAAGINSVQTVLVSNGGMTQGQAIGAPFGIQNAVGGMTMYQTYLLFMLDASPTAVNLNVT